MVVLYADRHEVQLLPEADVIRQSQCEVVVRARCQCNRSANRPGPDDRVRYCNGGMQPLRFQSS